MKNIVLGLVLAAGLSAAEVDYRQHEQQERVAQGIASGQLTAAEAARIENQESRLRREINRDRFFHNGRLTESEYRAINRQEDRLNDEIYFYKHNRFRQGR